MSALELGRSAADDDGAPEPTEVRLVGVDAEVVSPAWELELIVTGIVLVGLFQIPPWIAGLWRHWEPHVSPVGAMASVLFVLADTALYALIVCFVVALALRGYWVALVGANSVFPHGVRWDKQREYGPIQAEIARERVRPLPTFIGRVNNAASLVFATGFLLAAVAASSVGFLAAFVITFWVLTLVLPLRVALVTVAVFASAFALAGAGAGVFDMRRGATLARRGRRGPRLHRHAARRHARRPPRRGRALRVLHQPAHRAAGVPHADPGRDARRGPARAHGPARAARCDPGRHDPDPHPVLAVGIGRPDRTTRSTAGQDKRRMRAG